VKTYFAEVNVRLQKHLDNYGRYHLSVADSSFDTWLDGYVPGIPHRKTSIYDEGSLIALMLDLYIRKSSDGEKSLDDLFYNLYHDFALRNKGYREQDIRFLAESLSDEKVNKIIDLVHQTVSYKEMLQELLNEVGCYISERPSRFQHEKHFGFRVVVEQGITKVASVLPGSPAEKAGLAKDDEIVSCNDWKVESNLSDLCSGDNCRLQVFSQKRIKQIALHKTGAEYFSVASLSTIKDASEKQKFAFTSWTGLPFSE
jgi:predicted metalloprotease with PDZ domain